MGAAVRKRFSGRKYGLVTRIALLPILGVLVLLSVKGLDMYVDIQADRAFVMGQYGSDIAWHLTERRLLENQYLNNPQADLLRTISDQTVRIENLIQKAESVYNKAEIRKKMDNLADHFKGHQQIFEDAADAALDLSANRAELQTLFDESDTYLNQAINAIVDEETRLTIMMGIDLSEKKMALRSGLKEILSFHASAMLNMNELMTFKEIDKFEKKQQALREKMEVSFNNTQGVVLSVDEADHTRLWENIVEKHGVIQRVQDEMFSHWKDLQQLTRQLEEDSIGSKAEVQAVIAEAGKKIEAINRNERIISSAAILGGILLLGVISFLFILSLTGLLNRLITGLDKGALRIDETSERVLETGRQLTKGSQSQAKAIQETSTVLEEISAMANRNADNAGHADHLMKEAGEVIRKGSRTLDELKVSMSKVSDASERISKIVKTIDEIAFQTNLLALNASVEAARAGEAGAGFAVVANEVRNLAMRATQAAKETAGLIEETVSFIHDGSEHVEITGKGFSEIVDSTAEIENLLGEIAAASKEQALGIEQINDAVLRMDKVVQEMGAHSDQSAAASEDMNGEMEKIREMTDELVLLMKGGMKGKPALSPAIIPDNYPLIHSASRGGKGTQEETGFQ